MGLGYVACALHPLLVALAAHSRGGYLWLYRAANEAASRAANEAASRAASERE